MNLIALGRHPMEGFLNQIRLMNFERRTVCNDSISTTIMTALPISPCSHGTHTYTHTYKETDRHTDRTPPSLFPPSSPSRASSSLKAVLHLSNNAILALATASLELRRGAPGRDAGRGNLGSAYEKATSVSPP